LNYGGLISPTVFLFENREVYEGVPFQIAVHTFLHPH
jgi:hypothetical protein